MSAVLAEQFHEAVMAPGSRCRHWCLAAVVLGINRAIVGKQ
jgi:hypothetical protein